jgi:hypothetical protein
MALLHRFLNKNWQIELFKIKVLAVWICIQAAIDWRICFNLIVILEGKRRLPSPLRIAEYQHRRQICRRHAQYIPQRHF